MKKLVKKIEAIPTKVLVMVLDLELATILVLLIANMMERV
jgi:hypothetical protein